MAKARWNIGGAHEGAISGSLTDTLKEVCEYCEGVDFMFSMTGADVNSILGELAALGITAAGSAICGLHLVCSQCGHEQSRLMWIADQGTSNGTTITMTHLDSSVANNLTGYELIYVGTDANDTYQKFVIGTNTLAAPTVITTVVAPHLDSDGGYILTGFTTAYTPAA